MNRRNFLKSILGGAAAVVLPGIAGNKALAMPEPVEHTIKPVMPEYWNDQRLHNAYMRALLDNAYIAANPPVQMIQGIRVVMART